MMLEAPDGRMLEFGTDEWRAQAFDPSPKDPLDVVTPFLRVDPPGWVVLGGLGDIDEAQQARKRWPNARWLGIDPDPKAIAWQRRHGFPGALLQEALSDRIGRATIHMDSMCCSSMHPDNLAAAPPQEVETIKTTTLDSLDGFWGPFTDCVLSLDLEGWDCTALKGGKKLLASRRVQVVNVEVRYTQPSPVEVLLEAFGYMRMHKWFRQWWGHNEVWRLK